jgi:hypothetical protein
MNLKTRIATIATASILALGIAGGALAEGSTSDVSQKINGGAFSYTITNGTLTPITFDYTKTSDTVTNGSVTLGVTDGRGTRQGWSVSIQSSQFVYSGSGNGGPANNIPAASLRVTPAAPTMVSGESLSNVTAGTGGTLDASRLVINAAAGAGSGEYKQNLPLALTVPALSPTGDYVATSTVSTTAAPGQP